MLKKESDSELIQPDGEGVREVAARHIAGGRLIAYLTDTFYAIGANPFDAAAVDRVAELKGREEGKPILVLISDYDVVCRFVPMLPLWYPATMVVMRRGIENVQIDSSGDWRFVRQLKID